MLLRASQEAHALLATTHGLHALHRAVTDDRDNGAVALPSERIRLGQAVRIGQGRRRVRRLDPVVFAFGATRIARQAALLAQRVESVGPAGEDLVHIRLMSGIEQDRIVRRIEDAMHGEGQFDGTSTEVRAEVPTGSGDLLDEESTDLAGKFLHFDGREAPYVLGRLDAGKDTQLVLLPPTRLARHRASSSTQSTEHAEHSYPHTSPTAGLTSRLSPHRGAFVSFLTG